MSRLGSESTSRDAEVSCTHAAASAVPEVLESDDRTVREGLQVLFRRAQRSRHQVEEFRAHPRRLHLFFHDYNKVLRTAENQSGDGDIMNVAEDIRTLAKEGVVGQAFCVRLWIRSSRDLLIKDVIQAIDRLGAAHHDHAAKGRIPDLRGPQPL